MTASRAAPAAAGRPHDVPSAPPGHYGMLLFILAEFVLFGSLLSSYFYLRSGERAWPPEGIPRPELGLVSVGTVLLLASSGPMVWAESGIRKGSLARLRLGMAASLVLGAAFLGVQWWEYAHSEFGPADGVYGSLFFTITSLHGLHLLVGLGMLVAAQVWAALGYFTAAQHRAVSNIALYWHFVDVVWIFVFTSLYLSPHLGS